jgi:hypothetical protein
VAGAQHLDHPLFALVDRRQPERQRDAVLEDRGDDSVMGPRDRLQLRRGFESGAQCSLVRLGERQRADDGDQLAVVDEVYRCAVDAANAPEVGRVEWAGDRIGVCRPFDVAVHRDAPGVSSLVAHSSSTRR